MLDDAPLWYSFSTTRTACKHVAKPNTNSNLTNHCILPFAFHSATSISFNTLFRAIFIFFRTGTCLLPVSSSYSFWHAAYHPLCTPFPQSVMLKMHTLHEELIMANGNATRIAALFQQACIQAPIGNAFFNTTCRLTKPRQLTWVKSCSFAITSDNPFGLISSANLND